MKAPLTPTRFRTPLKHYHRQRFEESSAWETWIGSDTKSKKRKILPKLMIVLAVLAIASLCALAVHAMSAH